MAKQPPKWLWDRRARRWRHGGRWASPPALGDLRQDRRGRLIDGAGKLVPKNAPFIDWMGDRLTKIVKKVSKPKKSKSPKPKREPDKIQRLSLAKPFIDGVMNSSNWNKQIPSEMSSMFEKIIERASARSPFDISDILVYQHGVKFLGRSKFTEEMKIALADLAKRSGLSIKYAETNAGTELYVFMGKEIKLFDDVSKVLNQKESVIRRIYNNLLSYWGSIDWWYWFETEESLYE